MPEKSKCSGWDLGTLQIEFFSGLTVALALVPEAISFSFVAGVKPKVGLTASWIICIITSLLGGRPGLISAATGAVAVVLVSFVKENGAAFLFPCVLIMGVIQMLLGALKIGNCSNFISEPVMIGFCNGLAIVIGLSQVELFHQGRMANGTELPLIEGWQMGVTLIEVIATMLVVWLFPKLTNRVPSSLVAILFAILIEYALVRQVSDVRTATIEDFSKIDNMFPEFSWLEYPGFEWTWANIMICLPVSIRIAIVGIIESLLTLKLVDEITKTKGQRNREVVAQGLANVACFVFGGMGGCAMIGQTMINVNSGARSRFSGVTAGLTLLILVFALPPALNLIPVSGLIGVMFMVVIGTFEWKSLKMVLMSLIPSTQREKWFKQNSKVIRGDVLVMVLVTGVTLLTDLAIAVVVGIFVSCLLFIWKMKVPRHTVAVEIDEVSGTGTSEFKVYKIEAPLFFANCEDFMEIFDVENDPQKVIVQFHEGEICDYSALHTLNNVAHLYAEKGKVLKLEVSCPKSVKMVRKAEHYLENIEIDYIEEFRLDEEQNSFFLHRDGYVHGNESVNNSPRRSASGPVGDPVKLELAPVQSDNLNVSEVGSENKSGATESSDYVVESQANTEEPI